jgi:nicotinamidase-related amidase
MSTVIWIGTAAVVLAAAGVIIHRMRHGQRIGKYGHPQKALLVIDIQEDFTGATAKAPFPYKDSERLVSVTNKVIAEAAKRNMLVVYVRQEFDGFCAKMVTRLLLGKVAVKGTPGAEIDKRIAIVSPHVFTKPEGNAFSNPKLEPFLEEHQVDELYLAGLDAAFCVDITANAGLERGYGVTIITDATVTRFEDKWVARLKKYGEKGIKVASSHEFVENRIVW